MAYLIDGNNLIGHIFPEKLRDPASKLSLISSLLIFQRIKKRKITLVFDGPPVPELIDENLRTKAFSVVFPDLDENADQIIKRIIEKQSDLRKFYVVSSDREIRSFARASGAKSLTCEKFSKLLASAMKSYQKSMDAKKEEISLSSVDVDHWLHIFGDKK